MKREDYIEYLYNLAKDENLIGEDTEYLFQLYSELKSLSYMDSSRDIVNTELIDKLVDAADSMDKASIEGSISSTFIYHQIAEEWLHEILALSRFVIKLELFDKKITFEKLRDAKFSVLIKEVNRTIPFEGKEQIVQCAGNMNKIRNDIAHNLFKSDSIGHIQGQVSEFLNNNNRFNENLDVAY